MQFFTLSPDFEGENKLLIKKSCFCQYVSGSVVSVYLKSLEQTLHTKAVHHKGWEKNYWEQRPALPVLVHPSTVLTLALPWLILSGCRISLSPSCPLLLRTTRAQPPELKLSGAGEHLCGNPCSSAAGLSCPPFCSLQQRTLLILAQNPNLLHAPSHLAPLPSPGMAKLLKNQSKHFSVEDFPAQAVEELPKEIQL